MSTWGAHRTTRQGRKGARTNMFGQCRKGSLLGCSRDDDSATRRIEKTTASSENGEFCCRRQKRRHLVKDKTVPGRRLQSQTNISISISSACCSLTSSKPTNGKPKFKTLTLTWSRSSIGQKGCAPTPSPSLRPDKPHAKCLTPAPSCVQGPAESASGSTAGRWVSVEPKYAALRL